MNWDSILKSQIFLQKVSTGFIGCLRKFRLRDSEIGKWSRNHRVIPCSKKVEPGYFFGTGKKLKTVLSLFKMSAITMLF